MTITVLETARLDAFAGVLVQGSVRAFHSGGCREPVTADPAIEDGRILPPRGHGPGAALLPGACDRADAPVPPRGRP
jgi:hypothetical protein